MLEPDWKQPDPPGVKPVRARNPWLPVIVLAVLLGLVALAMYVPIPIFWREVPGPIHDVEDLITIEGAAGYRSDGSLYLTTVSFDDTVTFADWILAGFDEDTMVVLKDDITGGGTTEELLEAARADMLQSKENARNVALEELGLLQPAARIKRVVEESPAEGKIEVGDVIVSVAGTPVYTSCDVATRIQQQKLGEEFQMVVQRDGHRRSLTVTTAGLDPQRPNSPVVGIEMRDGDPVARDAPDVEIDTGSIGGPSAGLIFSLAIYDRLTPDDITHGREIAGTGGIGCDGSVIDIGGVAQKVAAAEDQGAEIFLAPAGNFEAAQAAADEIEVVSVATFDDAVEYLTGLS